MGVYTGKNNVMLSDRNLKKIKNSQMKSHFDAIVALLMTGKMLF